MPVVLAILALAALAWGVVLGRRLPMLAACAAMIALGYVLGPPLWSPKVGPVTLTVDRLLIGGLATLFVWQWRTGAARWRSLTGVDLALIALLAYLTVRTALTPAPDAVRSSVGPWWRLLAAFWIPAGLYFFARSAQLDEINWRRMVRVVIALGAYLAFTAVAEVTKQWWAVFPRYIADPTLGEHFGRARGPALMSASLGVYLTYAFWAAWLSWPSASRWGRTVLLAMLGATALGVFLTFTRSTWLGLAGGLAVLPILQAPRRWRLPLAGACGIAVVAGGLLLGGTVAHMGRQDAAGAEAGAAEHSVYQRASFVIVSMRMFRDAPAWGHGFGRFYDKKLPYISDRSQQIELDSIRGLDHHNTLLSILTETGLVGFGLYMTLLVAWTRAAWDLWRDEARPAWQRRHGVFTLGVIIAYLASALFHDLTLSPTEHWMLFLASGVASGLLSASRAPATNRAPSVSPTRSHNWESLAT
ncbi:MAG: O-antigen ligase family protein [Pirellulales bacterium]|nr:O-antigen ligase family protein [Pirellulales bacterium]